MIIKKININMNTLEVRLWKYTNTSDNTVWYACDAIYPKWSQIMFYTTAKSKCVVLNRIFQRIKSFKHGNAFGGIAEYIGD